MDRMLQIHPRDNVAVALEALPAGTREGEILLREDIPMGHKAALQDIPAGAPVIKYGSPIGIAVRDIPAGAHVHTHNLKTQLTGAREYTYRPTHPALERIPAAAFSGYRRKKGRPGIRNELWIVPTVGCVNGVAQALAREAQRFVDRGVEGVYAFPHPYGCSQMGEDQENTQKALAALCTHPNAGGVLLLGLGCENSGVARILPRLEGCDPERLRTLVAQDVKDEFTAGMECIAQLAEGMRRDRRTECSAAELVVGLKCGGSDGLSGITANPVIGAFSDLLTAMGGSTILTEVPEMFGAETILMDRCESEAVFQKTVDLINGFKDYYTRHSMPVYENPSPGNRAGGITTLEDKALGCTQKSGSGPVTDVLAYAEKLHVPGLNLLSAPGNDLVASTALALSGAQLVLFSTGRGTPFGCPVPTVKISSNSPLAEKKARWIDFDAGRLLNGATLKTLGAELMEQVLSVAGGKSTRSEENGDRGLAIFKQGVTL